MPPKKDKKKPKAKPKAKPRKKVIRMVPPPPQQALPRLPTGFNRDLPFGAGGGGSGNLISAIASRPQPPSQPLQTPDQFNAIREAQKVTEVVQAIAEEQKKVRKERSDKGMKRGASQMPTGVPTSMKDMASGQALNAEFEAYQSPAPSGTMYMAEMPAPSGMITSVGKRGPGRPRKVVETMPPSTPPPNYRGDSLLETVPLTQGGAKPQQGLFMGTEGKLLSAPADFSHSLLGALPIGASEGPP